MTELWGLVGGLLGVIIGWGLGEGTRVIKKWRGKRALRLALYAELDDMRGSFLGHREILEYAVRLMSNRAITEKLPTRVATFFFDNYYKDILTDLTRDERISVNTIYDLVNTIHKQYDALQTLSVQGQSERKIPPDFFHVLNGAYHNLNKAIYLISAHLSRKEKLDIEKVPAPDEKLFSERFKLLLKEGKTNGAETIRRDGLMAIEDKSLPS
jgi:hypothetical protein